jgi:hypothetical protein
VSGDLSPFKIPGHDFPQAFKEVAKGSRRICIGSFDIA